MKNSSRILIVFAGYVLALAIAAAVVHAWVALCTNRDDSSGMAAFSELLLFLGIFGVAAIPATGAALYFLRPYLWFWRAVSIAALVVAMTGIPALLGYVFGAPQMWAPLRVLAAPLLAGPSFLGVFFSPNRLCRFGLLAAVVIEAIVFVSVALIWFTSTR